MRPLDAHRGGGLDCAAPAAEKASEVMAGLECRPHFGQPDRRSFFCAFHFQKEPVTKVDLEVAQRLFLPIGKGLPHPEVDI